MTVSHEHGSNLLPRLAHWELFRGLSRILPDLPEFSDRRAAVGVLGTERRAP